MNVTDTRVKCGNCHNYHPSAQAVRECYFPSAPKPCMSIQPHPAHGNCPGYAPAPPSYPTVTVGGSSFRTMGATQKQVDYINDLGGDVQLAARYTARGASLYIDRLKKERAMSQNPQTSAPNRQTTKVPLDMLKAVPDGYYATRQDSNYPYTFFRFSRPKPTSRSQFAGALKIQTQHGPEYKLALVIWPSEKVTVYNKSVEDDLLLVVVDPNGSAMAYAEKIGRCMRCNTELTDDRSRWYGIGPECEKHRPHIIDLINDTKGIYKPGWES